MAAPVVADAPSSGGIRGLVQHRPLLQLALVGLLVVAFVAVIVSRLPGDDGRGALLVPSPSATRPPTSSAAPTSSTPITPAPVSPSMPAPTPSPTIEVTPSPVAPTPATYRVVSGDTLSGLAARWRTTVKEIMTLNGLTTTLIRVGQVLLVPVPVEPSPTGTGSLPPTPAPSPSLAG